MAELGYEEITDIAQVPTAVHGTMFHKWHLISKSTSTLLGIRWDMNTAMSVYMLNFEKFIIDN